MASECPRCHKIWNDPVAKEKSTKLIEETGGLVSEFANPGGRELIFSFGSIQISDQCYWCDYETIKKEVERLQMA
jgi:ssDNA-binding Zn-finger/Zn-ribbon topoisomerase 1